MASRAEDGIAVDDTAWVKVRSLDEFANLRDSQLKSHWWPDIVPHGNTSAFSFAHRVHRLGPVTILDAEFGNDVWVDGGEVRPHYQVTLPVATPSTATNRSVVVEPGVLVFRPEGRVVIPRYVGRLLALMFDRHAVEEALADALGRAVTSQIDFHPVMPATTQAVRSWIAMVSLFAQEVFIPGSVLHQPMVGLPIAESMICGLLMNADHPYRAELEGEAGAPAPRAIRTAIEIIEAEADQPLTVSALAARSYVSVRSLQQGFRTHLDTTPMAYLREVRLCRARDDLLKSDPSITCVASIALRWGFANFGRFAAAYSARYGENPAITLRRSTLHSARRHSTALA